jgi:hypothetical protein
MDMSTLIKPIFYNRKMPGLMSVKMYMEEVHRGT